MPRWSTCHFKYSTRIKCYKRTFMGCMLQMRWIGGWRTQIFFAFFFLLFEWTKFSGFFFVVFHTLLQSLAVRPSFCISRRVYVFLLSELIIYEKNKKIKTLSHCCRRRRRRGRRHRHNRHMHVKYRNETKLYVRTHETRCLTRNCVLLLDCVVCVYTLYIFWSEKREEERKWLSIKNQIPCHFVCYKVRRTRNAK